MIFSEAFAEHITALITFAILIFSLGILIGAVIFLPKDKKEDEDDYF